MVKRKILKSSVYFDDLKKYNRKLEGFGDIFNDSFETFDHLK